MSEVLQLTCQKCGETAQGDNATLFQAGWRMVRYKYKNKEAYYLCPHHAKLNEDAYLRKMAKRRRS